VSAESALMIVDLDTIDTPPDPLDAFGPVVVATSTVGAVEHGTAANAWAARASFTITEGAAEDRRFVQVESTDAVLDQVRATVEQSPVAAQTCDDVLRANEPGVSTRQGLTTESLAYSALQGGPEFARWLAGKGRCERHEQDDAVLLDRDGSVMKISFNRPERHNAFSNALRSGLIDGLSIALADGSVSDVLFTGNGRSFCSGGDLVEFGLLDDPSAAHLARTRYSPALLLDAVSGRLGSRFRVHVHGATLGSGLEMASYAGRVVSHPDTVFGLPELAFGLIPGAGGTVSVPRRVGRWRTSFLAISGLRIDATTALDWGLVDEITDRAE
jgi:enoyl-CoA hydratase/carnithine racemase